MESGSSSAGVGVGRMGTLFPFRQHCTHRRIIGVKCQSDRSSPSTAICVARCRGAASDDRCSSGRRAPRCATTCAISSTSSASGLRHPASHRRGRLDAAGDARRRGPAARSTGSSRSPSSSPIATVSRTCRCAAWPVEPRHRHDVALPVRPQQGRAPDPDGRCGQRAPTSGPTPTGRLADRRSRRIAREHRQQMLDHPVAGVRDRQPAGDRPEHAARRRRGPRDRDRAWGSMPTTAGERRRDAAPLRARRSRR